LLWWLRCLNPVDRLLPPLAWPWLAWPSLAWRVGIAQAWLAGFEWLGLLELHAPLEFDSDSRLR
jgi:hypothetical protein